METIKGTITKIDVSNGVGKNNKPFTRWVFHFGDKHYSTFNSDIGNKYKVGQNVIVELEQSGAYLNMVSMREDDGTMPTASNNQGFNNTQAIINLAEQMNKGFEALILLLTQIRGLLADNGNKQEQKTED